MLKAKTILAEKIVEIKQERSRIGIQKTLLKKFGPDYAGPKYDYKNAKKRGEAYVWIWKFENKQLGLSYPHVFHFKDYGAVVGKSRVDFAHAYDLQYKSLCHLASGLIKAHRGWTLIGEPQRVTHRQAIAMKIRQLESS